MRRFLRSRRVEIDGEPDQKGKRGVQYRSTKAQRSIMTQLDSSKHGELLGPVALELDFHCTSREPPSIQRLAKHTLDLIGPAMEPYPNRDGIVYRDDRQVKLLYVSLKKSTSAGFPPKGSTQIFARPLRDVVADLELVRILESRTQIWEEENDPMRSPKLPAHTLEPLLDLNYAASPEERNRWKERNHWHAQFSLAEFQSAFLQGAEARVASMLTFNPRIIAGSARRSIEPIMAPQLKEILMAMTRCHTPLNNDSDSFLLSSMITDPLPRLPKSSGEGSLFHESVRKELIELFHRKRSLSPLMVPLKVIFLVMPPSQGKDLDNLALTILPIIQRVIKEQEVNLRHPALQSNPIYADRGISAYEVIELKRQKSDHPDGYLQLALGSGLSLQSSWSRVTDALESYMLQADKIHRSFLKGGEHH